MQELKGARFPTLEKLAALGWAVGMQARSLCSAHSGAEPHNLTPS